MAHKKVEMRNETGVKFLKAYAKATGTSYVYGRLPDLSYYGYDNAIRIKEDALYDLTKKLFSDKALLIRGGEGNKYDDKYILVYPKVDELKGLRIHYILDACGNVVLTSVA